MDVGAWGTTLPAAGLLDTRALCECRRSECGQHAREDHREQTDHQQPRAPVRVGGRASTIGHPSSPSPMYPPGSQPGGMAKTAEPIGVIHWLSRSPAASRRCIGTNWEGMLAW